jgi:hypothetical protein
MSCDHPSIARHSQGSCDDCPVTRRGRLRAVAPPFFPGLPMPPVLGLPPIAILATRGKNGAEPDGGLPTIEGVAVIL